jgi:hypothetical protein
MPSRKTSSSTISFIRPDVSPFKFWALRYCISESPWAFGSAAISKVPHYDWSQTFAPNVSELAYVLYLVYPDLVDDVDFFLQKSLMNVEKGDVMAWERLEEENWHDVHEDAIIFYATRAEEKGEMFDYSETADGYKGWCLGWWRRQRMQHIPVPSAITLTQKYMNRQATENGRWDRRRKWITIGVFSTRYLRKNWQQEEKWIKAYSS